MQRTDAEILDFLESRADAECPIDEKPSKYDPERALNATACPESDPQRALNKVHDSQQWAQCIANKDLLVHAAEPILIAWPFHNSESFTDFQKVIAAIEIPSHKAAYNANAVWKAIPKKTNFSAAFLSGTIYKHLDTLEISSLDEVEDLATMSMRAIDRLAIMFNNYRGADQTELVQHFTTLVFKEPDLTRERAKLVYDSFRLTRDGASRLRALGYL